MARPIRPTPPVRGADARRLARELRRVAPPDVIARRQRVALDALAAHERSAIEHLVPAETRAALALICAARL